MKHIHICVMILLLFITSACKQKRGWYSIEKIDDRTYIISEPGSSQGNAVFLIMGSKEAILFDAGTGENKHESIAQLIRSLTTLPITVLLSHFHFDHIGSIGDFNRIAMPDILSLKDRISVDSLIDLKQDETLTKSTVTLKISGLFPVEKDIDLGNRKIKILPTPGHTKESISIIDNENGYIFTGDLIYNGLLLLDDGRAYVNSINVILENSDAKYRVFGSHGKPEVNYGQLVQIRNAIEMYLTDSSSIKPLRQMDFFGSTKAMYKIGDVSFIDGYSDVFKGD